MNYLVKLSVALMFLAVFPVGCINAQTVINNDLATDEAVIAALQKIRDAKMENARRIETRDVCIERLRESARVIVIGFFRSDVGCHFEGAFVNSKFYEADTSEIDKNALAAFGWQKANKSERERIAKIWVEKGLLAFLRVLQTKPKDFTAENFYPPRAVTTENGEVKVSGWLQTPPGMRSKAEYRQFEYTFSKDGAFLDN